MKSSPCGQVFQFKPNRTRPCPLAPRDRPQQRTSRADRVEPFSAYPAGSPSRRLKLPSQTNGSQGVSTGVPRNRSEGIQVRLGIRLAARNAAQHGAATAILELRSRNASSASFSPHTECCYYHSQNDALIVAKNSYYRCVSRGTDKGTRCKLCRCNRAYSATCTTKGSISWLSAHV